MRKLGKHEKKCQQCFEICNKDAHTCGGCGYHFPENEHHGNGKKQIDQRCQWTSGGDRCCFPGNSSRDFPDENGQATWYCRFHASSKSHEYGEVILEMSKEWQAGRLVDKVIYSEYGTPMPVYPTWGELDRKAQEAADAYCAAHGLHSTADCIAHVKRLTGTKSFAGIGAAVAARMREPGEDIEEEMA